VTDHAVPKLVTTNMAVLTPKFPDHSSPFSREQERRHKETALLSAAAKRFDAEGVHATRLEDIAADLGLTKTSIGYYHASKEDLAAAVYGQSADFLDEAVTFAMASDGHCRDKLLALFQRFSGQLIEVKQGLRPHLATINDLDALGEGARTDIASQLSVSVARVNELVVGWAAEEKIELGRPQPATFFVIGLLDLMTGWLNRKRHFDIEDASASLCDLLRHGLLNGPWTPLSIRPGSPQIGVPQIFDRETRNRMKREAFLRAGTRFFNKLGFGGVALVEVAASLGVTRGAFYYHFPDKEQLLDQCLEATLSDVEDALDRAEAESDVGLEIIEHALRDLTYQQASGVTPLLRPSLASALPAARQRRHAARLRNIARRFGDALESGISHGEARQVDVAIVEQILTNAIFINGGYTIAAANSFTDWRLSEDPLTATIDYTHLLMMGLEPRS
tara:strand:- start:2405 stop:3748 length:1344 start_codon:yes stop_codon:yes gene_type:complete